MPSTVRSEYPQIADRQIVGTARLEQEKKKTTFRITQRSLLDAGLCMPNDGRCPDDGCVVRYAHYAPDGRTRLRLSGGGLNGQE